MSRSLEDVLEARSLDERSYALLKEGNFAEAIPLCQRVVQLTPNIANRWARLGQALSLAQRRKEAIVAYDTAITLEPALIGVWLNMAWDLIFVGRYEEGLTAAERACSLITSEQPEAKRRAYRTRSLALLQLKRYDDALSSIDELLAIAPEDGNTWTQRGNIYIQMQRFREAEESILRGVELKPESAAALKELTDLYQIHLRDYAKAQEACERLVALRPHDALVWRLKGEILYKRRAYQDACLAFEQAIACDPPPLAMQVSIWSYYSVALVLSGRYGDALAALDNMEKLPAERATILNNRGEVYRRIGRFAEALELYIAARNANPATLEAQANIADILMRLERFDEAKDVIDTLVATNPNASYVWCYQGVLETVLGHHEEALAAFNQALAKDPRHPSTYVGLARLLLTLGDAEQACQVIELAMTLDPCDVSSWRVKAQALRATGREVEADAADQHATALLAEQVAQVDAYLRAKEQHDQADG